MSTEFSLLNTRTYTYVMLNYIRWHLAEGI